MPISETALDDRARERAGARVWRVALVKGPKWTDAEPYARESLCAYASALSNVPDVIVQDAELPAGFDEAHQVHAAIYEKLS